MTLRTTPAKHDVPENTYVILAGSWAIYFGGDSLLILELHEIADRFPYIDLALVPLNGLQLRTMFNKQVVMNASEAAALAKIMSAKIAISMHDKFKGGPIADRLVLKYNGTAEVFREEVGRQSPNIKVIILSPGQELIVS